MIVGHQKQWEFLKKSFLDSKISHAYLFSGPKNMGKKTLALEFIKYIFCQALKNPPPNFSGGPPGQEKNRPCNLCSFCQAILKKTHPDFIEVLPEKREIQIFQIRDLIWKLSLKPFLALYKTAIIDRAHLMNAQAQNCLLKTLEEPKGNAILILITEHPELLFETIRSRLQEIKFFQVPKEEIENFLREKGVSEKKVKEIAFISLGRPGKAIEFLENPKKLENEKEEISRLAGTLNSDLASRFQWAKTLSKKNLGDCLEIWLRYFREVLLFKTGNLEKMSFSANLEKLPVNRIKKIIEELERFHFLILKKNINKRLALEILMMQIKNH